MTLYPLLLQITITLNLVVLAVSEMEMNVISAERVTEYTNLPSEVSPYELRHVNPTQTKLYKNKRWLEA